MKWTGRRLLPVLAMIIVMALTAFSQGAYWESNVSGAMLGDRVMSQKVYYMPKMMKSVDENGNYVIVRLDQEKMYNVEPAKKEYSEMTFAEIEESMQKMNSRLTEMQKNLDSMPPEQREMVKKMIGDMASGDATPATLTATGEKKTISGYPCAGYVVTKGDKKIMDLWVTNAIPEFNTMRKDWQAFNRRMMELAPGSAKSVATAFEKLQGFPIEMDWEMGMKNVVTKFEKRNTAAGEFLVPSGYAKVDSPLKRAEEQPR